MNFDIIDNIIADEDALDRAIHNTTLGKRSLMLTKKNCAAIADKAWDLDLTPDEAAAILEADPNWLNDVQEFAVQAAAKALNPNRNADSAPDSVPMVTLGPDETMVVHDTCPECGETRYFDIHELLEGDAITCEHCGHVSPIKRTPIRMENDNE